MSRSLSGEELVQGINDWLLPPPAEGADPDFRPPPGFGPGNFLSPPILKIADADQDGRATAEEWSSLFRDWSEAWDKNDDDTLDGTELGEGLDGVLRPPPGFRPPGDAPTPIPPSDDAPTTEEAP